MSAVVLFIFTIVLTSSNKYIVSDLKIIPKLIIIHDEKITKDFLRFILTNVLK